MKTLLKNILSGLIIGFTAFSVIYASLSSVQPGETLTSNKWNELVGTMNTFSGALDGGLASPTGAVIAFNRETCPSGWLAADGTNGTPDLRGVFIRGLNNFGTGERSDGYQDQDKDINNANRTLGSLQYDTMRPIMGKWSSVGGNSSQVGGAVYWASGGPITNVSGGVLEQRGNYAINSSNLGSNFSGSDTHPKNIALIYCVKE